MRVTSEGVRRAGKWGGRRAGKWGGRREGKWGGRREGKWGGRQKVSKDCKWGVGRDCKWGDRVCGRERNRVGERVWVVWERECVGGVGERVCG